MAGGQQGPSFRRHVHLVEQLPWEGAISGMRSDCDLVIWIRIREAAASGVRFFRSANEVLLTETTIDSAFFQSVQILRSSVLTADGGPPHPQQVALAISRAPTRDTQHRERYMASYAQEPITAKPLTHACDTRLYLPCRTLRQMTRHQGRSVCTALRWMRHIPNRVRRLKVGVLPRRRRRRYKTHLLSGPRWATLIAQHLSPLLALWATQLCPNSLQCHRIDPVRHELNALLCARLRSSRESKTLPPRIGCGLLGSHSTGKDDRLRNYSPPGPKSGVGSNLVITLILLQSQLSHSVRVPALSVGAGEGNPSVVFL